MSDETDSILVWYRNYPQKDAIQLRVVRVSTGEEFHFADGNFLLRVSVDVDTSVVRCLVRHIASGDEAHVQSGPSLLAFVQTHLIGNQGNDESLPGN